MKRGLPLALLPLLLAVLALASPLASTLPTPTPRPAIQPLTPAELGQALNSGTWLIVEFGGESCIPCRAMQPILQGLRTEFGSKLRVHNFWIQEHPEVARRFKIMLMPTQVVFDPKGQEVLRHEGVFDADEFRAALAKVGLR